MKNEKAMEGRYVDAKGVDHGDAAFHRVAMGQDEGAEIKNLESLEKIRADLAESQVDELIRAKIISAKNGMRALMNLFPKHGHYLRWQQHLEESEKK